MLKINFKKFILIIFWKKNFLKNYYCTLSLRPATVAVATENELSWWWRY